MPRGMVLCSEFSTSDRTSLCVGVKPRLPEPLSLFLSYMKNTQSMPSIANFSFDKSRGFTQFILVHYAVSPCIQGLENNETNSVSLAALAQVHQAVKSRGHLVSGCKNPWLPWLQKCVLRLVAVACCASVKRLIEELRLVPPAARPQSSFAKHKKHSLNL